MRFNGIKSKEQRAATKSCTGKARRFSALAGHGYRKSLHADKCNSTLFGGGSLTTGARKTAAHVPTERETWVHGNLAWVTCIVVNKVVKTFERFGGGP
jgi:hypothetical protein